MGMCGLCYAYKRYVTLPYTNPQSMGFSRSTNALKEIILRKLILRKPRKFGFFLMSKFKKYIILFNIYIVVRVMFL